MYDSTTADLIRGAPSLRDLDCDSLPDRFTEAFARVAAIRVHLRTGEEPDEDLTETKQFAKRLAQTNEALVAVSPARTDRRSAAFVAATAYQLLYQIEAVSAVADQETALGPAAITADVSAMLLFLIAESSADATEVSQRIHVVGAELQEELLRTLVDLAQGRLGAINDRPLVASDRVVRSATDALYHLILRSVRDLALILAGQPAAEDPTTMLRLAQRLASQSNDDPIGLTDDDAPLPALGAGHVAVFPGPYHLASLLLPVANTLSEAAVVGVPPPGDLDPDDWHDLVSHFAEDRPYLWQNHRDAISKGYLRSGVSSIVSFPTGAGKSAVFKLKIGAALLDGQRVVFLAPTHALVDQTRRDLTDAFPDVRIFGEPVDALAASGHEDILVMTPEACLVRQHAVPHTFEDTGLLVFDECHLIHGGAAADRRSIDAMLCVLNFVRLAPTADLLLVSAMIKNTTEVAAWAADLTGREALAFDMTWKPTRQLRGCVVYEQSRIEELNGILTRAQPTKKGGVPAAVGRQLTARPYGFFSVKQTWASTARSDYAYLRLCAEAPQLGASFRWPRHLTPNAGVVATALASAAARNGVSTLVFSQSIRLAVSISDRVVESLGPREVPLRQDERRWAGIAADELGGQAQLYVDIKDKGLVVGAAPHHGLLLPEERRLIEALYRRSDGLGVLSATSTLGQGMNLPSELVIVAEDSRFDEETGRKELLEARELLNAAGRAGRAGRSATGIVVVIPGQVVGFDDRQLRIGSRWKRLQDVFGQTDQCLVIDDPLTAILDRVHSTSQPESDLDKYVVSRLCGAADDEGRTAGRGAISKTLGAFRKRLEGDTAWIESRTEAALALLEGLEADDVVAQAVRHLSSALGLPEDVLSALRIDVLDAAPSFDDGVHVWRAWMFEWMSDHPGLTMRMFRPEDLGQQFGSAFTNLQGHREQVGYALPKMKEALELWMAGEPLTRIQPALSDTSAYRKKAISARRFVVRLVPALAHVFSSLSRIIEEEDEELDIQDVAPTVFYLDRCVRLGLSSLDMYALFEQLQPPPLPRREIHRRFEAMRAYLTPAPGQEAWPDVKKRVTQAWRTAKGR